MRWSSFNAKKETVIALINVLFVKIMNIILEQRHKLAYHFLFYVFYR